MRVLVVLVLIVILVTRTPAAPHDSGGDRSAVPSRFHARLAIALGSTYSVNLRAGVLTYVLQANDRSRCVRTIKPTLKQWRAFRRAVDAVGFWRWQATYMLPDTETAVDGAEWQVTVSYPGTSLSADVGGVNSYPGARGEAVPDPSPQFLELFRAVEALLGGLSFGVES